MFAYLKRNVLFLTGNSGPGWFEKLERPWGESSREGTGFRVSETYIPNKGVQTLQ